MSLWTFAVPSRYSVRVAPQASDNPLWNLFNRMTHNYPGWVAQLSDATWIEVNQMPSYQLGGYKYLVGSHGAFGATGFGSNVTPSSYETFTRLYRGGVTYVIGDTLKAELIAAVTSTEASGYAAYIAAAPGGSVYTGDEIIACGKHSSFEQGGSTAGQGL